MGGILVVRFRDLDQRLQPQAGGKGGTLARLFRAGYPVPAGFVILPGAFEGSVLVPDAGQDAIRLLGEIRGGRKDKSFAVRSSALSEDSAEHSFAGQMDTVLDCLTDEQVLHAISKVRSSGQGERAGSYAKSRGLERNQDVAVVVQEMVHGDIAGVLFTCDPVTGSRTAVTANFVKGTGERLVSGEANAQQFTVKRPGGSFEGPAEVRPYARGLFRLGERLERELGGPQDIEWAASSGRLFLLQSRPITSLRAYEPGTGEWNDSLSGDFFWSCTNFTEAVPDIMTPATWSWWGGLHRSNMPISIPGCTTVGNIGGRPYMNLTFMFSLYRAAGMNPEAALKRETDTFGVVPDGITVPIIPISRMGSLRCLFQLVLWAIRLGAAAKKASRVVSTSPEWCSEMERKISSAATGLELVNLWREQVRPYAIDQFRVLYGVNQAYENSIAFRRSLSRAIGEEDTNILLSNLRGQDGELASLGPVMALERVARGEMTESDYLYAHGHRGPHEAELSEARPMEDPGWLRQEISRTRETTAQTSSLLAQQRAAYDAVVDRLKSTKPSYSRKVMRRLSTASAAARNREAVRSEVVRVTSVARKWVLRAGEMTGLGGRAFFLTFDEMERMLSGDARVADSIDRRMAAYERYHSLPYYPVTISGRFDPFQWARDPDRRTDSFDSHITLTPSSTEAIKGFAGASGRVTGRARVLHSPDESHLLEQGEILVTPTTNVGWTLVFPRCAAVVTDIGAPLSHAYGGDSGAWRQIKTFDIAPPPC